MSLVENALVLGAVTTLIVWLLRKLKWPVSGVPAMWLTMGVSVVIAVIEAVVNDGFSSVFVCNIGTDPVGAVNCLVETIRGIAAQASAVWLASQGVYQILRVALTRTVGPETI